MGDWNFLGGILEEVHIHSTMVGKIWLTILFIFRMLVLGVAAEDVWNDEQSDFICNTEQPGCRNVCYDCAFPVSLIRYWVLQVIFVSSPSLVYMGHALYRLRALEKQRQRRKATLRRELEAKEADGMEPRRRLERELRQLEQSKLNKAPLRGALLRTYVAHIITRSAVEVAFMAGQYLLYGLRLDPLFKCEREPCPNTVDCFISRPTEKSVFMVFMQGIAGISLFLSILEVVHLGFRTLKKGILGYCPHLKDELEGCYLGKSKNNSQVSQGTATGHKAAALLAPGGYGLQQEKQAESQLYPTLSTPSPDSTGEPGARGAEDAEEDPPTSTGYKKTSNTSSNTHSPPADSMIPPQQEELKGHLYPTLPGDNFHALSCPTLVVGGVRRPRRVSAPWHCFTVEEANGSDADTRSGEGGVAKARFPGSRIYTVSKSDPTHSTQGSGSESDQSLSGDSPLVVLPDRRMSLANIGGRLAATDLQV